MEVDDSTLEECIPIVKQEDGTVGAATNLPCHKLTMIPIVYTTKLDDMVIFKSTGLFENVNSVSNEIYKESKPKLKKNKLHKSTIGTIQRNRSSFDDVNLNSIPSHSLATKLKQIKLAKCRPCSIILEDYRQRNSKIIKTSLQESEKKIFDTEKKISDTEKNCINIESEIPCTEKTNVEEIGMNKLKNNLIPNKIQIVHVIFNDEYSKQFNIYHIENKTTVVIKCNCDGLTINRLEQYYRKNCCWIKRQTEITRLTPKYIALDVFSKVLSVMGTQHMCKLGMCQCCCRMRKVISNVCENARLTNLNETNNLIQNTRSGEKEFHDFTKEKIAPTNVDSEPKEHCVCCWCSRDNLILNLSSLGYPGYISKFLNRPPSCRPEKCNCCCTHKDNPHKVQQCNKISKPSENVSIKNISSDLEYFYLNVNNKVIKIYIPKEKTCCWYSRDSYISELIKLGYESHIIDALKKPHSCKNGFCKCCCKNLQSKKTAPYSQPGMENTLPSVSKPTKNIHSNTVINSSSIKSHPKIIQTITRKEISGFPYHKNTSNSNTIKTTPSKILTAAEQQGTSTYFGKALNTSLQISSPITTNLNSVTPSTVHSQHRMLSKTIQPAITMLPNLSKTIHSVQTSNPITGNVYPVKSFVINVPQNVVPVSNQRDISETPYLSKIAHYFQQSSNPNAFNFKLITPAPSTQYPQPITNSQTIQQGLTGYSNLSKTIHSVQTSGANTVNSNSIVKSMVNYEQQIESMIIKRPLSSGVSVLKPIYPKPCPQLQPQPKNPIETIQQGLPRYPNSPMHSLQPVSANNFSSRFISNSKQINHNSNKSRTIGIVMGKFGRFKDLTLSLNDQGKVSANIDLPINNLSDEELTMLAEILNSAQKQVDARRANSSPATSKVIKSTEITPTAAQKPLESHPQLTKSGTNDDMTLPIINGVFSLCDPNCIINDHIKNEMDIKEETSDLILNEVLKDEIGIKEEPRDILQKNDVLVEICTAIKEEPLLKDEDNSVENQEENILGY